MWEALFWIYIVNATLLITHEIDSAYWREWELFKLPGGLTGFLVIHLPFVFLLLYGLILVDRHSLAGLIFSLALGLAGLFAFVIHMIFIKKGDPAFRAPVSLGILVATLAVSIAQVAAVILGFVSGLSI